MVVEQHLLEKLDAAEFQQALLGNNTKAINNSRDLTQDDGVHQSEVVVETHEDDVHWSVIKLKTSQGEVEIPIYPWITETTNVATLSLEEGYLVRFALYAEFMGFSPSSRFPQIAQTFGQSYAIRYGLIRRAFYPPEIFTGLKNFLLSSKRENPLRAIVSRALTTFSRQAFPGPERVRDMTMSLDIIVEKLHTSLIQSKESGNLPKKTIYRFMAFVGAMSIYVHQSLDGNGQTVLALLTSYYQELTEEQGKYLPYKFSNIIKKDGTGVFKRDIFTPINVDRASDEDRQKLTQILDIFLDEKNIHLLEKIIFSGESVEDDEFGKLNGIIDDLAADLSQAFEDESVTSAEAFEDLIHLAKKRSDILTLEKQYERDPEHVDWIHDGRAIAAEEKLGEIRQQEPDLGKALDMYESWLKEEILKDFGEQG
jgi:hypothetical protein